MSTPRKPSPKNNKAAADAPSVGGLPGGLDPARVLRLLLARWPIVLVALVVSSALAFVAGKKFSVPAYRATGTLVYTPLPVPEAHRSLYQPQKFETLVTLVATPANLDKLSKETNIPAVVLRNSLKVEEPMSAEKINVTCEWDDAQRSAEIANRLMDIYIKRVAESRIATIQGYEKDAVKAMEDCEQRLDAARKQYRAILDKAQVLDLKEDLAQVRAEVAKLDAEQGTKRREVEINQAQIKKTKETIDKIALQLKDKTPVKLEIDETYKRRMQELERNLALEENRLAQGVISLQMGRDKEAKVRRLVGQKVAVQEELDEIVEKTRKLEKEVATAQSLVQQYRQQRDEDQKNPVKPYVQKELERLRELESKQTLLAAELDAVPLLLAEKRKEARRLSDVQTDAEVPGNRVTSLEAERKQLEDQQQTLRSLRGSDKKEFVVESAARVPSAPQSGANKKVMLAAFALPMLLVLGTLVGLALISDNWKAETLASQLNLPVLARADGKHLGGEQARRLALHLRQHVADKGGTILFSSLHDGPDIDELVGNVGRYLGMRDESVLILDARIGRAEPAEMAKLVERSVELVGSAVGEGEGDSPAPERGDPRQSGLVQYLVFDEQKPSNFIHATTLRGVSFLPAGGPCDQSDALASGSMKDLLTKLRKDYSVVLLVGPALSETTDTEILAAYAHGMLAVLNGAPKDAAAVQTFVNSLRDADAPLVGSVVCV